jgi:hypothetical protein
MSGAVGLSGDGGSYPAVDAALLSITTNNKSSSLRIVPPDLVAAAVKLLTTVLQNVVKSPGEPKYRALKKANKHVAAKILPCRGALQLLTACGFRNVNEVLMMTEERVELAKLQYAIARLGRVGSGRAEEEASAVAQAQAERAALYRKQQEERAEDRRVKAVERRRLDEQRAEFSRRQAAHPIAAGPVQGWAGDGVSATASTAALAAATVDTGAPEAVVAAAATADMSSDEECEGGGHMLGGGALAEAADAAAAAKVAAEQAEETM